MDKLKDLLHELRCDIAAIPVNKENKTEIKNAQETLAKAFNELLRLYNVVGQGEQYYCELFAFGRQDKRCFKQCGGCEWMEGNHDMSG